jgi:tRNA 2-selenouridine synthase
MLTSPLVVMDVEFNTRLQHLVEVYCNSHESNDENLILSFKKIGRRIGSEKMNLAINSINQKRYKDAAEIALDYYDKCYAYDISKFINIQ